MPTKPKRVLSKLPYKKVNNAVKPEKPVEEVEDESDASDRSGDEGGLSIGWDRPKGDVGDPGYSGWEQWTPGRWAWEFLRRNAEFHEDCDHPLRDEDDICEKFHLARFKHYDYSYDRTAPLFAKNIKALPTMDRFASNLAKAREKSSSRYIKARLRPNEILIKFRIETMAYASTSEINRQLAQAKKKLQRYAKALKEHRTDDGANAESYEPLALLNALRVLDLIKMSGFTENDIAAAFPAKISEPAKNEKRKASFSEDERAAYQRGNYLKNEAEKFSQKLYLKVASSDQFEMLLPKT